MATPTLVHGWHDWGAVLNDALATVQGLPATAVEAGLLLEAGRPVPGELDVTAAQADHRTRSSRRPCSSGWPPI